MIELDKPLNERHPLELLELNFYRARLLDDNLTRAMEKIQAAAVELVALEEVSQDNPGPASLHSTAASKSLMHSYRLLAQMQEENQSVMNGLASYLVMQEVELFESMEELVEAQSVLKLVIEEEEVV